MTKPTAIDDDYKIVEATRQKYVRAAMWREFWHHVEWMIWLAVILLTGLNLYWILRGQ